MEFRENLWLLEHFLSMISFLLGLAFVALLLKSRKSPSSTWAWLFLLILIPYAAFPFYLLFGGRKLKKRAAQKKYLYEPIRYQDTPQDQLKIERILLSSGSPNRVSNEKLIFLKSGEEAYQNLMEMIEAAKQRIYLEVFILANDSVGKAILLLLEKKALSGVEVFVLVDAVGSFWMNHPSFRKLKKAGGKVAFFMPIFHIPLQGRSNLRNHRKLVLVDGADAVFGGLNIAEEYLGPSSNPKRWVEFSIRARGNLVSHLEDIFISDWNFACRTEDRIPKATSEIFIKAGTANFTQVAVSGPDVPKDPLYDSLLSVIFESDQRIWIVTPYFIPDESLTRALELAIKRGLDVKILIPKFSNHWIADLGRGSYIRQLEDAGASILLYPKMIHAKVLIADHTLALVGSANMDMRSLLYNYELGVFLYSLESIQEIESWMLSLFSQAKTGYPKTNVTGELVEGIGRTLSPLL